MSSVASFQRPDLTTNRRDQGVLHHLAKESQHYQDLCSEGAFAGDALAPGRHLEAYLAGQGLGHPFGTETSDLLDVEIGQDRGHQAETMTPADEAAAFWELFRTYPYRPG